MNLGLSLLTFFCLFFVGHLFTNRQTPVAVKPLVGFGLFYTFAIASSIVAPGLNLQFLCLFFFLLSIAGFLTAFKRPHELLGLALIMIITAPLLWVATNVKELIWDDYTHWLVSARFVFDFGHLPIKSELPWNHGAPGYPYGLSLLHGLTARWAGSFSELNSGFFNILFAGSTTLWGIKFTTETNKNPWIFLREQFASVSFWSLFLFGWIMMLSTRLISSSYCDPMLAISFGNLFVFMWWNKNQTGSYYTNLFVLATLAMSCMALKQIAFYYIVIACIAIGFSQFTIHYMKANQIQWKVDIKTAASISTLMATSFFGKEMWSYYRDRENVGGGFYLNPISEWRLDLVDEILVSIGDQFLGRPYFISLVFILALLALKLARSNDAKMLYPILSTIFFSILFIFLHLTAYAIASFDQFTAARASSFDRYSGVAGVVTVVCLLYICQNKLNFEKNKDLLVFALLPFIFNNLMIFLNLEKFIQPERNTEIPLIARELNKRFKDGPPVQVIEMSGNGGEAVKIIFLMNQKARSSYLSGIAYGTFDENYFRKRLQENILYVHNADKSTNDILIKLKREFPTKIIYTAELLN